MNRTRRKVVLYSALLLVAMGSLFLALNLAGSSEDEPAPKRPGKITIKWKDGTTGLVSREVNASEIVVLWRDSLKQGNLTRQRAIESQVHKSGRSLLEQFEEILFNSDNSNEQSNVVHLLGKIWHDDTVDILDRYLDALREGTITNRNLLVSRSLHSMAEIGTSKAWRLIQERIMQAQNPTTHLSAISVLGKAKPGNASSVELLSQIALRDADRKAREVAINSLGQIGGLQARETLRQIAHDDPDKLLRERAEWYLKKQDN